MFLNMWK